MLSFMVYVMFDSQRYAFVVLQILVSFLYSIIAVKKTSFFAAFYTTNTELHVLELFNKCNSMRSSVWSLLKIPLNISGNISRRFIITWFKLFEAYAARLPSSSLNWTSVFLILFSQHMSWFFRSSCCSSISLNRQYNSQQVSQLILF